MVHFDGHEVSILGSMTGIYGIIRGTYGKGWAKQFMHRQPIMAFSCALGVTGMILPVVIVPMRRRLGLPTNQYDATFPGTVAPTIE